MLVYFIFIGGPTFAVLYQAWRAWDFFVWWRPVQATTLSSDYGETERLSDTGPFAWLTPRPWSDANGDRRTKVRIGYDDWNGRHHQAQVTRMIHRGRTVMPSMKVFYDSRKPDRVDPYGPTGPVIMVVFWSGVLIYMFHCISAFPLPK